MLRIFSNRFVKAFMVLSMFAIFQTSFAHNVVSDSVITAKIKGSTIMDQSISALNVDVETNNGVVTLDGTVESDTQASALVEIAQSTRGVRDVDTTNLTVKKSRSPVSDTYITAKVKGRYIQDKLFNKTPINPATIHVETNNGVVYLSGTTKNQRAINKAVSLARSVSGVKDVESRLKIRS